MCYKAKSCLQRGEISQHAKLEPKRSPCPRPCSILRALDVDHCSQGGPPPFPFPSACCCTGWCMAVLPTMVPNRSRCRMAGRGAVESGIVDAGTTAHKMDGWRSHPFTSRQNKARCPLFHHQTQQKHGHRVAMRDAVRRASGIQQ